MGIYSGNVSLTHYRIVGLKKATISKYNSLLENHCSPELSLRKTTKEEIIGWVLPPVHDRPEEAEGHWDLSDCQVPGGFLLRARIERRRVPGELLQITYRRKFNEIQQKRKNSLTREEKQILRDDIRTELTEKALPAISYVDGFWQDSGSLLVFTVGKKANELFVDLFKKTFVQPLNGDIIQVTPPFVGINDPSWAVPEQVLTEVEPMVSFIPYEKNFFDPSWRLQ